MDNNKSTDAKKPEPEKEAKVEEAPKPKVTQDDVVIIK